MATARRYARTPVLGLGEFYGTSYIIPTLRKNIASGNITILTTVTLTSNTRLDHLAGVYYQDGSLWWVLAICSNVGFSPQCPAGTRIVVPKLSDILKFLGKE